MVTTELIAGESASEEPTTTVKAVSTKETTGGESHATTSETPGQTAEQTGETLAHEAEVQAQPENPILPTGPELAWAAVSFTLLWALMKFVLLKPIQATMAERAEKVRSDGDHADRAKEQAEAAVAEYEASLAGARAEASRIIDDARTQAEAKRREIIAAAEAEVAEAKAAAAAEVAEAKATALADLRGSVATIAVQAAEAVIQKPLDAGAQRAIVDEYLSRASQN